LCFTDPPCWHELPIFLFIRRPSALFVSPVFPYSPSKTRAGSPVLWTFPRLSSHQPPPRTASPPTPVICSPWPVASILRPFRRPPRFVQNSLGSSSVSPDLGYGVPPHRDFWSLASVKPFVVRRPSRTGASPPPALIEPPSPRPQACPRLFWVFLRCGFFPPCSSRSDPVAFSL